MLKGINIFTFGSEHIIPNSKGWNSCMEMYREYDTNIDGDCNEELDISGNEYEKLLLKCFEYCDTFSIRVKEELLEDSGCEELIALENYRIPTRENVLPAYSHYYKEFLPVVQEEIRCYRLLPETKKMLTNISNSIFAWISTREHKKPEDLAFYRRDGSVFFSSTVHEGYCNLFAKNGEKIDDIINNNIWHRIT